MPLIISQLAFLHSRVKYDHLSLPPPPPLYKAARTRSSLHVCSPSCCSCLSRALASSLAVLILRLPISLHGDPPGGWRAHPWPRCAAQLRHPDALGQSQCCSQPGIFGRCGEGAPTSTQGDGISRKEMLSGRATPCLFAVWMPAPTFQGSAVLAAELTACAEGDFGGFPRLLCGKPFQPPNEPDGRGPAVPAEAPASQGRLLASHGIFSSGLTGAPYVCVLLFPSAFYVLSRCRKESRSLPAVARMRFRCSARRSPLRACIPELCL